MSEYRLPNPLTFGSLRFVKRIVDGRELRILQTYQSNWEQDVKEQNFGSWFDVPLLEEADGQ